VGVLFEVDQKNSTPQAFKATAGLYLDAPVKVNFIMTN
jgi:hypothetical protein